MKFKHLITFLAVIAIAFHFTACTSTDEASEEELKAESNDELDPEVEEAQQEDIVPEPEVIVTEEEPAPPPAEEPKIVSDNRLVFYVKSNDVSIHDSPSTSGKVVGTLQKGDHVLAEEIDGWAKIGEGRYVSSSNLSRKAVSRDRKDRSW